MMIDQERLPQCKSICYYSNEDSARCNKIEEHEDEFCSAEILVDVVPDYNLVISNDRVKAILKWRKHETDT